MLYITAFILLIALSFAIPAALTYFILYLLDRMTGWEKIGKKKAKIEISVVAALLFMIVEFSGLLFKR